MTSIFISYAREDANIAMRLYNDLENAGAKPWIDSEKLLPGQNWELSIKKAIRSSDLFIALFSNNSIDKKGYFQKEIKLAMSELEKMPPDKISFIPCRIEDVEIPYEPLNELHWVNLFPNYEDGLKKIYSLLDITESTNSYKPEDNQELLRQLDQNLLIYKLAEAKRILENPMLFSRPTWLSEVQLFTTRSLRRLYETVTRVQKRVELFSYNIDEQGNGKFILQFKHIKEYEYFAEEIKQLLSSEGVQILQVTTRKNEMPTGQSAAIIPPDDSSALLLRSFDGQSILYNSQGVFDATKGVKLNEGEISSIRETKESESDAPICAINYGTILYYNQIKGFYVVKSKKTD